MNFLICQGPGFRQKFFQYIKERKRKKQKRIAEVLKVAASSWSKQRQAASTSVPVCSAISLTELRCIGMVVVATAWDAEGGSGGAASVCM